MKESSSISHTYAQHFLRNVDSNNKFLDSATLHMHIPEGAVPKDGPSAGVTMTTSLLSLALKKPVRKDLAMTGELTLTGKVLPVGGIKVTHSQQLYHTTTVSLTMLCLTYNYNQAPRFCSGAYHASMLYMNSFAECSTCSVCPLPMHNQVQTGAIELTVCMTGEDHCSQTQWCHQDHVA